MSYLERSGGTSTRSAVTSACSLTTARAAASCHQSSERRNDGGTPVTHKRSNGRNAASRIHHPGQNTPWNNQKPTNSASAPAAKAVRYPTLLENAAVIISASTRTAAAEASTARKGWRTRTRPHSTGAYTESLTKWYLTVPFRIQLSPPPTFSYAAAASATPIVNRGIQSVNPNSTPRETEGSIRPRRFRRKRSTLQASPHLAGIS